ncbi:MAG: calcineurin-like phosphoesterase C-terminal domain-containing protein [Mangrovibacterium sp.]
MNALKDFSKVHFMCGHTHYHENFFITSPMNIHEHIHAAACGAWWKSTVNCDGVPNGYAVYDISGTAITNWYYKPTNYSKDFQIRLHWGDTQFGGQYGYFNYKQGGNIVANIWNADPDWRIEAYEDGVNAGNLTKLSTLIDAWAAGYHVGVLNRNPSNYGATGSGSNKHAYLHTLKNKNARTIEIRATDRFGTVYRQTGIISDLKTAEAYN